MTDAVPSPEDSSEVVTTSPADTVSSDEAPKPPTDAPGWRTHFASLPTKDILRVLQKDKGRAARILTGFRPSGDALRHPIVAQRLIDEALKQPKFAEEIFALTPKTIPKEAPPASDNGGTEQSTPATPAPPHAQRGSDAASRLGAGGADKEALKKQRAALKEKETRIAELEASLAAMRKERDTAQSEVASERTARQNAQAEVQRERRLRERAERREASAPAPTPKPERQKATLEAIPVSVSPVLLEEGLTRLVRRGKYASVAEVCREALMTEATANRGSVHALYAAALYGQGQTGQAEEQDRLAVNALMDAGRIRDAAEALARLLSQAGAIRAQSDGALLRRLQMLAEKTGKISVLQDTFQHMQISSPESGRRLRALLTSGGKKEAALLAAVNTPPETTLGPDEAIALPVSSPLASSVTARAVARAVEQGEAGYVRAVREGLQTLRQTGQSALAAALLEAVAKQDEAAVTPLLAAEIRPVVVDASNVARFDPDPLSLSSTPRVVRLRRMRDFLLRRGFFPVLMVADANLRFHVDDRAAYQEMVDRHVIRETPPGTSADEALIMEARALHAPVVTNDRLADWEQSGQIERLRFLLTNDGIALSPTNP
jgi:hypothetical protein